MPGQIREPQKAWRTNPRRRGIKSICYDETSNPRNQARNWMQSNSDHSRFAGKRDQSVTSWRSRNACPYIQSSTYPCWNPLRQTPCYRKLSGTPTLKYNTKPIYQVERIHRERTFRNQKQYLVRWEGCDHTEDFLQLREHFASDALIRGFQRT
jgi:hypothetical protein